MQKRTAPLWLTGSFSVVLTCSTALAAAPPGVWLGLSPDGALQPRDAGAPRPPQVTVPWYDDAALEVTVLLNGVQLTPAPADGGEYVRIECPDTPLAGPVGAPGLPVVRRLFQTAPGATVTLEVADADPVVIDLATLGLTAVPMPMQGPFSYAPGGSVTEAGLPRSGDDAAFQYDSAAYATNAFLPTQRAAVSRVGIVRGVELWLLEVHPVAYHPARGSLALWPELGVSVRFTGGERSLPGLRPAEGTNRLVLNPPPQRTLRGGRGGNFLVIAASGFVGSAPLNQFMNAKAADGFTVLLYTVAPGTSRTAIKNYVKSLWGGAYTPDYILVVGDALGNASTSTAQTVPCWIAGGPRPAGTDLYYACMDPNDDWLPDIAIGRFPVQTTAELQAMVDKTLYVEAGEFADPTYTRRAAFVAGTDLEADAETLHNYVIDTYITPAGIESQKLYMQTYGADTQDMKDALNNGVFLMALFGHAAGFQAWGQPLFTFADIESLTNQNLYPFVASFGCSPAAFHYTDPTQSPGFHEKWMRVLNKGVAAAYGEGWSLDDYTWSTWGNMYKFLMRAIYTDNLREVGNAAQTATQYFVSFYGSSDPVSRDYAEEFILQGDPSLRLPDPPGRAYLIITAPSYVGGAALTEFIAHRQSRGYRPIVYNVPEGTPREDIKAYVQSLWATSDAPEYILIVGDTNGATSTATTIPHWVGIGSRQATTDLPYACMDAGDDWYPEIALGRFPCLSETQLQAMVDKTIHVESGSFSNPNYVKRVAFLCNADTNGTAEPTAEWIISTYLEPNLYEPIRIYAAEGGDTQDVTNAVNTGSLMVTYMGHSGSYGWSSPGFNQDNVRALTNSGLYPLAFGWSCNTAHYDIDECFGETWVRESNKGAAAYLSASNFIYWGSAENWLPSDILQKSFFAAFFEDDLWNVGPAWQDALYRFLDEYGLPGYPGGPPTQNADIIRNFFEEMVLLGDPALRLPQPNGFALGVTPPTQTLCCPPENMAFLTVNVQKLGTFAEPVTLSVWQGLPPGATISFSTNGALPPFTSVLTLGNLANAPFGEYDLVIRGVSATKEDFGPAHLSIANAVPPTPALTSPGHGAVEVSRQPTLVWQAAAQAADYYVELATDLNFAPLAWSTSTPQTSAEVGVYLDAATTYYWRVRAASGCGNGNFAAPFSFTTISMRDYFTELFEPGHDFDLQNTALRFIPDASANYYRICGAPATALPNDPNGGTLLTLGDDTSAALNLPQPVSFFGVSYNSLYVNSNGNISFGSGDNAYTESIAAHFDRPRACALFDDLHPGNGGQVSWLALADRIAVTFWQVPEYSNVGANTFQFELLYNGEVRITWTAVTCLDALTGLSPGGGVPPDFVPNDLSAYGPCAPPGACCVGPACTVLPEEDCLASNGTFLGSGTDCEPNPCIDYSSVCLIISEVVQGTESGDCPRFIELTNTGTADFAFLEGGLIVQTGDSNDVTVDINLSGVTIAAGQAFVVASNAGGACTGAFQGIYGHPADLYTSVTFGYGNERLIVTDTADGSHLLDIYGEFGVNGSGQPWEYTDGYSYRLSACNSGHGGIFAASEWFFGGVGSLTGPNPTQLLLDLTTPAVHAFDYPCTGRLGDLNCDTLVDFDDISAFVLALSDPAAYAVAYPDCNILNGDCNHDGAVDFDDINAFVALLSAG